MVLFSNKTLTCTYYRIMDIFLLFEFSPAFLPPPSFSICSPYFFTPFTRCTHKRILHSNTYPSVKFEFRNPSYDNFPCFSICFFFFHSGLASSINKQSFFCSFLLHRLSFFLLASFARPKIIFTNVIFNRNFQSDGIYWGWFFCTVAGAFV